MRVLKVPEWLITPYFIGYIVKCKMKRESIETPSFTKKWFALGFTDDDLAELQQFLRKNPEAGDITVETGSLKKIRFAFQGRGKSGSSRVCYVDFATFAKTYLIQVFSKEEQSNLTDAEKNAVKEVIGILKIEAARNWRKEHE